jgi:Fe-S cluster assembly iron-binding protein IscA
MIHVTPAAVTKLQGLLLENPDDSIVRITLKDLDDERMVFSITLEPDPQPDDEIQEADGLTLAIGAQAALRMHGITLDYQPPHGFRFHHPMHQDPSGDSPLHGPLNLN